MSQAVAKVISEKVEKIKELIAECEQLSKETGVPFSVGTIIDSAGTESVEFDDSWESSNCEF